MMVMDNYHIPVMLEEAGDALHIQENGIYVDETFGGGGHSRAILSRLGSKGRLIAFDQDPDAKLNADMLSDDRLLFIPRNFRFIQSFLNYFEIGQVDGVLADLGVSSHQFDEGTRGFSTRFDGPLDMRMNYNRGKTAKDILSESTTEDLLNMFSSYGEVRNAKELVKRLQAHPSIGNIKTTQDFNAWIKPAIRGPREKYLAQVYQALRIAVNDELSSLTDFLDSLPKCIKPGGYMAIITFHSLEDRLVKRAIKGLGSSEKSYDPIFGAQLSNWKEDKVHSQTPSSEEVAKNSRARSARLRVACKVDQEAK